MAGDEDPKHPHPPPSFSPPPAAKPKAKVPSEMAYRGKLHASERRSLKRSLEIAKSKR